MGHGTFPGVLPPLLAVFLFLSGSAFSQNLPRPDALPLANDTLRAANDTLPVPSDTTIAGADTLSGRPRSGIDSVVTYAAVDSVIYDLSARTMYLHGNSSIAYKELGLKASVIDINWTTSLLNARGTRDTSDTSGQQVKGLPDLIDGKDSYQGSEIAYNFRTKKGRIDFGKTELERGLYYGDAIKKAETDVLYVQSGRFTTCELDHPHYYFGSPTMKVIVRDKVVARPIYLYISDVPVFALPFGVFPSEQGRRSGLIAPAFGESDRGHYLLHLGYYWAINDYMDFTVRTDAYTLGSYTLYGDYRYALRYNYTGYISGSYGHIEDGEEMDPGFSQQDVFNFRFGHNQEFDPTMRLVVDMTFTSGSYYQNTSNNLNDLLLQNIISNATLTKFWEGTPNSMSVNIRRDQNLQPVPGSVELSEVLPGVSFSSNQSFPFRSGSGNDPGGVRRWYEMIGMSYSGQFLNSRTTSLQLDSTRLVDARQGVLHSLAINAPPKAGYFTLSPFFNYTEKWYNKQIERDYNPADSTVTTRDVEVVKAVRYFDLGVSVSTKLYGIFQPGILGIKGIRHQIIPSVSYTYQPDFSRDVYGYYDSYVDASGTVQRYSRYEKEVFGGAPSEGRQAISMRVGNVFEMKTAVDDTSDRENKFQLLNLDLSTSYNLARDSLKFDEVFVGFRTNVGQWLNIGGSARYNLYQYQAGSDGQQSGSGHRVNKFLLSEEGRFGDLTGFSISIGTRLNGEKTSTSAGPIRSPEDSLRQAERGGYVGLFDQEIPDFSIPWNLDLTWNFNQSQPGDPRVKYINSTIAGALGFNLTENWKISASTSYDLRNLEIAAPQITVYRDLHCWEMNFVWVPTGAYQNYRLEIRLKSPQLQDVKLTKQESARNIF